MTGINVDFLNAEHSRALDTPRYDQVTCRGGLSILDRADGTWCITSITGALLAWGDAYRVIYCRPITTGPINPPVDPPRIPVEYVGRDVKVYAGAMKEAAASEAAKAKVYREQRDVARIAELDAALTALPNLDMLARQLISRAKFEREAGHDDDAELDERVAAALSSVVALIGGAA